MRQRKNSGPIKVLLLVCVLTTSASSCNKDVRLREESCQDFLKRKVSSLPFDELIRRGSKCLSADDEALLNRAQTVVLVRGAGDETVEQLLTDQRSLEAQAEKFDLPQISPTSKNETTPPNTDLINPNVQRSPVFIYAAESDGTVNKNKPIATGFFVGIPATGNRLLRVFVTARHVINRAWADCPDKNPAQIYLRFNLKQDDPASKQSGVAYERLDAGSFYQPDDNDVDVAVSIVSQSMMPYLDKYDVAPIWLSLFATDDELQSLKIGDQVYTSGLVPSSAGVRKNNVSFTFATVSSLNDERLSSFCAPGADPKFVQVWGLTPNLNEGRSGSPIFRTRNRKLNGELHSGPVLVGIQSMATKDGGFSGMTKSNDLYKTIRAATKTIAGLDFNRGFP